MSNNCRIVINDWTLNRKGTSFINDTLGYRITLIKQKYEKDMYYIYDLISNKHLKSVYNIAEAFLYIQKRIRPTETNYEQSNN